MANRLLSRLRIVLVEPAGPLNLGSIARVMKNMGVHQLVLVNPHCHPTDDDARLMAVHAADVLNAARLVTTLPEALVGCHRAVATTARDRDILDAPLEHPRQVLPWLLGHDGHGEVTDEGPGSQAAPEAALIFGPEDRGLSNTELSYAQRSLRIPSSPTYPSLNLAQAVAICCYELYQLTLPPLQPSPLMKSSLSTQPPSRTVVDYPNDENFSIVDDLAQGKAQDSEHSHVFHSASLDDLEGFYNHFEELLLHIGYIYPHTADSRMKKFRRVFNRSDLTTAEVSMLRGVLRQMAWALNQAKVND